MSRWILVGLSAVAGCGATGSAPPPSDNSDEAEVVVTGQAEEAMAQPLPESEVIPDIGGIGPVLSWGNFQPIGFVGSPHSLDVADSGGPVDIVGHGVLGNGHYRIEYDILLTDVDSPAVAAMGRVQDRTLYIYENDTIIVSANFVIDDSNLVVEVLVVESILDPDTDVISLVRSDAPFSLVIFGDAIDSD